MVGPEAGQQGGGDTGMVGTSGGKDVEKTEGAGEPRGGEDAGTVRTWGVGHTSGGVSRDTWNVVIRTFRPALELPAADRSLAGK